jgi:hypothetical protein
MTIDPKSTVLVIHDRKEGKPFAVTVTHKPSKTSCTGEGPTLDDAKAAANAQLETWITAHAQPAGVM